MRVLCIATAYPRHEGDHVTPWLPELIRRLRARDVEVEVLTSAYRGLGDQMVAGVRVHRFRYAPASLEHLTHDRSAPAQLRRTPALGAVVPAYIARGRAAAERLALTGRFDLVHVLWPVPHAILGAAAKRAGRLPLVSTFFGSELAWRGLLRTALAPAARSAVRVSDRVTAISRYTADLLRRLVPDAEARVIPIGAAVEPPPLDSGAGTGGGPSLELLYVGRLTRRKGVHVLLDALATAPAGTVLHVLGEGPERAALEIRAAKLGLAARVRLHGFVPRDQLARRYRECDALVLPSLAGVQGDVEGLGIPAIEALSFGKPVIASRVGGIGEIVEDGATGILVPPGDAGAISRAIAAIDGDRAMGRRLGEKGREHVQRTFAWTPILDALVDEYDTAGRRSAVS